MGMGTDVAGMGTNTAGMVGDSGVTRVGDTRGGNRGCHPLYFLVSSSAVLPWFFAKPDDLFCSSLYRFLLLSLGC